MPAAFPDQEGAMLNQVTDQIPSLQLTSILNKKAHPCQETGLLLKNKSSGVLLSHAVSGTGFQPVNPLSIIGVAGLNERVREEIINRPLHACLLIPELPFLYR